MAAVILGLHTAVAANDGDRTAQQLLELLRHTSSVRQSEQALPDTMQLIELTVKALPCCSNSVQVSTQHCYVLQSLLPLLHTFQMNAGAASRLPAATDFGSCTRFSTASK